VILWVGPVAIAIAGGWMYMHGGRIVSTDNAYLKSGMVSISSEVGGKVMQALVEDNQRVTAGQLLLRVDDEVYRIALAHAEANLLKVRSNVESLRADLRNKQADVEKAQSDYAYYR
jgi:membrane fusion protein (multidrug efflux system)